MTGAEQAQEEQMMKMRAKRRPLAKFSVPQAQHQAGQQTDITRGPCP